MKSASERNCFEALLDGYAEFRARHYRDQRDRYERLATEGQNPKVMVIACSDSRVDPATVFHAAPGEMFVLRHIAALVPPCERDGKHHSASAAIEYAVSALGVEHVVVFGHGGCGGIAASLSGCFDHQPEGDGGFVHHWVDIIAPARDKLIATCPESQRQLQLELEAIRQSLHHLRTFPHVEDKERHGRLTLHGAHFDIRSGLLQLHDANSDQFFPINPDNRSWAEAA